MLPDLLQSFFRGAFPHEQFGWITRGEMQHEKHNDRYTQQRGDQYEYSSDNIGKHR
jgi:hypothetical protein